MPNASSEFVRSNEIVRAGAGAGKTYTLTHKVMDIASEHMAKEGKWPRLVVTTFTRKATQELRERLMLLALDEYPDLVEFVTSRSYLMVSTIHGVMDSYLKRYGAKILVDPGYDVIDEYQATKMARQVLRKVVFDGGWGELLERVPFNKLVGLVREIDGALSMNPSVRFYGVDDFAKLFDAKARSIADRLISSADSIRAEATAADWLAMAEGYTKLAKMLQSGAWTTQRNATLEFLDSIKTARMSAKNPVCEQTNLEAKAAKKATDFLSEPMCDPAVWTSFSETFALIETVARKFSEEFRKEKNLRGWLEIDDLELLAMECSSAFPETAVSFSKEWDHWLVDEYQDTSPFQVALLRNLVGEAPCFVVGDPQQSIYLFRGAQSDVFERREKEILAANGTRTLLTMNRRSDPELLSFFNDVFSHFDPPFQSMEPFLEEGEVIDASRIVAHVYNAPETDDGDEELKAIVAYVQALREKGVRPDGICVLARTNSVLEQVAEWLSRYEQPTHVHAASGFFDRRETRDSLALLKFLVNPHDDFNLVELLRSPWFRVPDRTLVEIEKKKDLSLWERLTSQRSMSDEFEPVGRLERHVEEAREVGISGAFRNALVRSGFVDFSHRHDASGRRESNVWKLLARLETEESLPGFNPLAFVAGTTASLKVEEGSGEGDAVAAIEPDRINLMTIHASKGLEFDHVILPRLGQKPRVRSSQAFVFDPESGLWASRLPHGDDGDMTKSLAEDAFLAKFQEQELHEHSRVLYVAMTRAVKSIFLTWTGVAETNSWAESIRLNSVPGIHATKSYSYEVHEGPWVPRESSASESEVAVPRAKYRETRPTPKGAASLNENHEEAKPLSVTEMLDRKPGVVLGSDSQRDVVRLLKSAATGTAVHKLMELLKYPSRDRMDRLVTKWFPGDEARVLAAVDFVRDCRKPALAEIIVNGEVEWGFAVLVEGLLIEGQVDLWGRTDSGEVWIVDYKTGTPEYKEKAYEQMSLYALALRASGLVRSEEKIRMAAVFPFSKQVFEWDELSREATLAKFGLGKTKTS